MKATQIFYDNFNKLLAANDGKDKRADAQQQHALKTREKHRLRTTSWLALLLLVVSASGLEAQDTSPALDSVSESEIVKVHSADSENTTFQWKSALVDSSIFLGVEHGFRILQDPNVREGLKGPFFKDYIDSVKSIHGWGDGDPFLTNYIAHPTQGAVTGFIEIGNDPQYRSAEFGASSRYWESRMRAMAFSAAYSLQFEIGPISEASIGNVQLHSRNDGIVDWVITPTLGTAFIVVEDLTDKYLIRKVERHTRNVTLLALARTFLNPCRGFSNIMGRRAPWHRDDRPGIIWTASQPR
jgi:hypothetical protein